MTWFICSRQAVYIDPDFAHKPFGVRSDIYIYMPRKYNVHRVQSCVQWDMGREQVYMYDE